jgi:hypothetical protein
MPNRDDVLWFKQQFHDEIKKALKDTPFSLDMITALACLETGYVWQVLRKNQLSSGQILELCVGDTIDGSTNGQKNGRSAFPRNKAELVARPNGEEMFRIAREALVNVAQYVSSYRSVAAKPNKFCHGFGVLQYDLQFFKNDPDFFLQKRYTNLTNCLEKCLGELRSAIKKLRWEDKTSLSDYEMACVAIVYNKGSYNPKFGLKQGHLNGNKYYGEDFFDYLRLCHSVPDSGENSSILTAPAPGRALVSLPSLVKASGPLYEVGVRREQLRLRSEPKIDQSDPQANVIARLPDGQIVQAVTNKPVKGFLEVETSLLGALYRGFASVQYLKPAAGVTEVPAIVPAPTPPSSGIIAVYMPRSEGTVTSRAKVGGAHSLNEGNQPGRTGTTADELRAELGAIIDWLAVDKATHLRFQPRGAVTFCNIYAHDYCHLAGVYLPRVWWTHAAIELLAQGKIVQPSLGKTIDEVRANGLFSWLRDFGPRFGWRSTGTLSKLQLEVNQGAIGLIVARRVQEERPGHVVAVVPETDERRARRDAAGEVIAPLQSQAGVNNFRYGTGRPYWWKDARFAEYAFWLHA